MRRSLAGNSAAAWGFRLSRVDTYPYYPITPSTSCSEQIAAWVADGEMNSVVINVESEHSAASAVIASSKSVRAGTATSSKGLLYMIEVLENASGNSLPFTIFVGNRATGAPINIWGDHSDAYAVRDAGFIQIFSGSAQETLDDVIQAYRIGEDLNVRQPVFVNLRGFTGTHTYEPVDIPDAAQVDAFLPEYLSMAPMFSPDQPVTFGPMLSAPYYRRHKRNQSESLRNALEVTEKVGREYGEKLGRSYKSFEWHGAGDAKLVVILLGESGGAARAAVSHLMGREGVSSLAVMRVRLFNPFPSELIAKTLHRAGTQAVVVLDEGLAHGDVFPPLASRVASSLQTHLGSGAPQLASVIGGLGGSEIRPDHFQTLFNLAENIAQGRPYRREPYWLDIEEDPVLLTDQSKVKPRLWKRYGDIWKAQPILQQYHAPFPASNYEVRLYGRAGQGAITSAVFFTGAGIEKGLWVLTKPTFGSERRGAVVHCDTLIQTGGEERTRSFTGWQDLVCIYDDTILQSAQHAPASTLKPDGTVVVNTTRYTPNRIREMLHLSAKTAVYVVPASKIARELQLGSFFNMVMLGAIHRVCPLVDLEASLKFYKSNVPAPKEKNLEAIRRGHEETTDREIVVEEQPIVNDLADEYFNWRPEEESFELAMLRSLENPRGS